MTTIRKSTVTVFATALAALIGYLFNPFFLGPRLGPQGIAVVGTFTSLFFMLSFSLTPINMTLIHFISQFNSEGNQGKIATLVRDTYRVLALAGLALCGSLAFFANSIAQFLNLNSNIPVISALCLFYLGLLVKVTHAPLQALLRFNAYAVVILCDPLLRLVAGVILISLGWGISGALSAYLFGYVAILIAGQFFLRDVFFKWPKGEKTHVLNFIHYAFPILLYAIYINFALSIDSILAKHYFLSEHAGYFMAVNTLAKLIFILITPLSIVSFSFMSKWVAERKEPLPVLMKFLIMALAGIGMMLLLFFMVPEAIISVTYGSAFKASIPLLFWAGLAIVPVSLLSIISNYFLAKKSFYFVGGLFAGAVIRCVLLHFFHSDLGSFVIATCVAGIIELFLGVLLGLPFVLKKQSPPEDSLPAPEPDLSKF